jgi:hypothetical protein
MAVAASLVVGAAGCSSGSHHANSAPTVGSTVARSPSAAPSHHGASQKPLRSQLLTLADAPQGWVTSTQATTITTVLSSLCGQGGLPGLPARRGPVDAGYQAGPKRTPVVGEELRGYASDSDAESVVAETQKESTGCGSFKTHGVELEIKPLPLPALGDYSFDIELSARGAVVDAVYVEVGSTVLNLTVSDNRNQRPLLLAITKRAIERLQPEAT